MKILDELIEILPFKNNCFELDIFKQCLLILPNNKDADQISKTKFKNQETKSLPGMDIKLFDDFIPKIPDTFEIRKI